MPFYLKFKFKARDYLKQKADKKRLKKNLKRECFERRTRPDLNRQPPL